MNTLSGISITSESVHHRLLLYHTFPLPVLAMIFTPFGFLRSFYRFLVETWTLQTGLCVLDCLRDLFVLRRKQPWNGFSMCINKA